MDGAIICIGEALFYFATLLGILMVVKLTRHTSYYYNFFLGSLVFSTYQNIFLFFKKKTYTHDTIHLTENSRSEESSFFKESGSIVLLAYTFTYIKGYLR